MTQLIETDYPSATIRRRKRNQSGLSDGTCTPAWLAERLPLVDLDPASNPRSHIRARWTYSIERGLNGIRLPWRGSVFLNNPYSQPMPWMVKLRLEILVGRCTEAIVLPKFDPSTEWWAVLQKPIEVSGVTYTPDLWQFNDRIEFDEHPQLIEERRLKVREKRAQGLKATEATSNNFPSAIVHWRFEHEPLDLHDVATLWRRP